MNVIYEITVTVSNELIDEYEKYMRERHIPALLQTGNFSHAYFTRAENNRYRIQYHAHDKATLDKYLQNDAASLRDGFAKHFPFGIEVSREIWEILQSWQRSK